MKPKDIYAAAVFLAFIAAVSILMLKNNHTAADSSLPPFLKSPVIKAVEFDFSSHKRLAEGSDNWPVTWGTDGHLYTIWGDGGGFGGSNQLGRSSFGVARIEGSYQSYNGVNVHGGYQGLHPGQDVGYTWGLISVADIFYIFAGDSRSELFLSKNRGETWKSMGWQFGTHDGPFSMATFVNYGKDNAGAYDKYVYIYAPSAYKSWPEMADGIDLARVQNSKIADKDAYEFYAGTSMEGVIWVKDINERKQIIQWPQNIHWTINADFIPHLNRFLITFNRNEKDSPGALIVLDSPTPWGPWTLVNQYENFGNFGYTYAYHFPAKWSRDEGKAFTMVFSGGGPNDSWNTIDGKFVTY